MKKLSLLCLLLVIISSLSACSFLEDQGTDDIPKNPEDVKLPGDIDDEFKMADCQGSGNYVIVEGTCIVIPDLVSRGISINGDETVVNYMSSVELMTDFVADLTGSTGLAVVDRDIFDANMSEPSNVSNRSNRRSTEIHLTEDDEDEPENIIVKLNEDGFFEEVSFTDDSGFSVEIKSNPLALEVFGEFTVVAFEVDFGYEQDNQEFTSKLYDSLYAGGIYLIHNETGKLFATKEVVYTETSYEYFEDFSRTVTLEITLNEPVIEYYQELLLDENGNPILDEEGLKTYTTIENPLFDESGNPLIFTEGPLLYETVEAPVYEYFQIEVLDEDGNPVLDENGKPTFTEEYQQVLDDEGNPKMEVSELPVLDEDGNPVYQETFEIELYIEDQQEFTVVEYHAEITENPLSVLAQRFVDKIVSEYYNWNYYRVNNYQLENHSFAYNKEAIFYMEYNHIEGESEGKQMLKKVSFDPEFNEIVIEEFLDITKASFDQCTLMIDPLNNNIICDGWEGNIKVYSETLGLMTIPDSETLQPVTFPNGELFFFDMNEQYNEDLGYSTTVLYKINSDGTLESNFVELGEKNEVCYGDCLYGVSVNVFTQDGIEYSEMNHVDLSLHNGDNIFSSGELYLQSVGDFDSSRPVCEDNNGCWYNINYELLDTDGNLLYSVVGNGTYYPADTPPNYIERYTVDDTAEYTYDREYNEVDKYCENEIGCQNNLYLIDESINQNGLWVYENTIINQNDHFLNEIRIKDSTSVTYEYERDLEGDVCEYESCSQQTVIKFYDQSEELFYTSYTERTYAQNEIMPLYIEYRITDNTNIVYEQNVCTTTQGCYKWYNTVDGIGFEIVFEKDEVMYHSIEFDTTDITKVTSETQVRELCTNPDGCWSEDVTYKVLAEDGSVLYEFSNGASAEYGYRMPFTATVSVLDCTFTYQKDYIESDAVCHEEVCYREVFIEVKQDDDSIEQLTQGTIMIPNGELVINRITLSPDSFESTQSDAVCLDLNGCIMYSENFTILDEDSIEYQTHQDEYWHQSLPVFFEYGEVIPNNNNFEATFEMKNVEYRKTRIGIHEFMYRMQEITVLDDNLYLITRDAWQQGDENFILTFNQETNRYRVMYTNITSVLEITEFEDGYIAINEDETAIIQFSFNEELSTNDYYYFNQENLTDGLQINGVNDLIVDYDGSIYFSGVDNFIQDITGSILEDGTIVVDTEYNEHEVIRVRPLN